ncbi:hypothetical protein DTW90_24410 [Neorhizobium sp. P12A]|nr:hypothetical protein DTW90_24410 [Neorhizobium sp. P12A]
MSGRHILLVGKIGGVSGGCDSAAACFTEKCAMRSLSFLIGRREVAKSWNSMMHGRDENRPG